MMKKLTLSLIFILMSSWAFSQAPTISTNIDGLTLNTCGNSKSFEVGVTNLAVGQPYVITGKHRDGITVSNITGAPSPIITGDGTDEGAMEKLAYQTKGVLDEVAAAYQLKFDETLSDRMSKELDSEELQNWRNIVS